MRTIARSRQRMVELSDGRHLAFSEEAIESVGLAEGAETTAELFAALEDAEHRSASHEAALRLLATRARSEREMRTRLAIRGFAPGIIETEILRLARAGLLDDEQFARTWVADRQATAPRGRRMLRYELLGRGIAPDSVEAATRDLDDREVAFELARRKARGARNTDFETFVARVGGFLRRRGFEYELAAEAARAAWAGVEEDTAGEAGEPRGEAL